MEHPTGTHRTAIDAMEDAIRRLRALPKWDRWITFTAQSDAARARLRLRGDIIDVGRPVKPERVVSRAKLRPSTFVASGRYYSCADASPREAALLMDVLFRHELGVRPFEDERGDYAVGAEW